MSHVLTVKIPESLLERLERAAQDSGRSKGALVREAVEGLLQTTASPLERIETITRQLWQGKGVTKGTHSRIDWDDIKRNASHHAAQSPEEDVRRSRRRGL